MTSSATALRSEPLRVLSARLALVLPPAPWRTRYAPAPTGYLHLGHVLNAIHVWGIARAHGGHVVLRIEDHDRTRVRAAYESSLLDDLDWMGFMPDIGSTNDFRRGASAYRQSDNLDRYANVLANWNRRGYVYPCACTRSDIGRHSRNSSNEELRSAGLSVNNELCYPGTCAKAAVNPSTTAARRARIVPFVQQFDDVRLGSISQMPATQCGDVLVRDRNGNFTYQLAVVVDDCDQDIDVIIRGEDLLESTGRQLQLAAMLGQEKRASYLHHSLLMRSDGIKLSKSLGDSGVRELREAGLSAGDVLGRAAFQAGLITRDVSLSADDVALLFAA